MKHQLSEGFPYYIELVENLDYKKLFFSQEIFSFLNLISEEKSNYAYQNNKWNIKQIVGHLTDYERVMIYRAFRFSRKDTTPLASFDEQFYVENSRFNELSYTQLLEDFKNVRTATNSFISNLSSEQLLLKGFAWKYELTVEGFLQATIGHQIHHVNIINEKYF